MRVASSSGRRLSSHIHIIIPTQSTPRVLRICIACSSNYLNGGVIEHFLPSIVELPLMRIGHKLLLGKCHRLLGGNVDFCKCISARWCARWFVLCIFLYVSVCTCICIGHFEAMLFLTPNPFKLSYTHRWHAGTSVWPLDSRAVPDAGIREHRGSSAISQYSCPAFWRAASGDASTRSAICETYSWPPAMVHRWITTNKKTHTHEA